MINYTKYISPKRDGSCTRTAGIRPSNHSSRIPQILEMVNLASKAFPETQESDIHVVAYDGDRWKGQIGIEFEVPSSVVIPEGWIERFLEDVFAGN